MHSLWYICIRSVHLNRISNSPDVNNEVDAYSVFDLKHLYITMMY